MDVVEKPHPADDRRSKSSLHVFMFSWLTSPASRSLMNVPSQFRKTLKLGRGQEVWIYDNPLWSPSHAGSRLSTCFRLSVHNIPAFIKGKINIKRGQKRHIMANITVKRLPKTIDYYYIKILLNHHVNNLSTCDDKRSGSGAGHWECDSRELTHEVGRVRSSGFRRCTTRF